MFTTNARRTDPTRTTLIRQKYADACVRHIKTLRSQLTTSIVDRDCFGLSGGVLTALRANELAGFKQFAFTSDARKHDAFMDWLRAQIDLEVLETVDRHGNAVDPTWQDTYVRAAYQRGVTQAALSFPAAIRPVTEGFFYQPVHASALEVLFTRNFEALKGVTDAMASAISRELTLGFAQGLPSIQLAKNLTEKVDSIGLVRARTLARTEVIHAHAQATLNVYEQMGVEEVGVEPEVEFITAGDSHVCVRCHALSGKVYAIKDARRVIPVHPACRCRWLALVKKEERKAA